MRQLQMAFDNYVNLSGRFIESVFGSVFESVLESVLESVFESVSKGWWEVGLYLVVWTNR
jgi:hypothetical protein